MEFILEKEGTALIGRDNAIGETPVARAIQYNLAEVAGSRGTRSLVRFTFLSSFACR